MLARGARRVSRHKKRVFPAESRPQANNSPQKRKMILTTCAACAAPLAHDAPRCVRCKTRYCDATCQHSTLLGAFNLGLALNKRGKYAETKSLLHGSISDAQRTLGDNHKLTLDLRSVLADTLACLGGIDNLRAAVAMREDVYKRTRQIFGALHPKTQRRQRSLEVFRAALADLQAGRPAIIQFTSNNI